MEICRICTVGQHVAAYVRWHDHEEKEVLQHDVESPLMPLQGPLRPNRPCAVVAAALGPQPSRRLHLVRVPDIWSTP